MRRLAAGWVRQTPLRWHVRNGVTRIEVIQRAIDELGAVRYLEIGVDQGSCFCAIRIAERIGVDPVPPSPNVVEQLKAAGSSYAAVTSDDFFSQHAPRLLDRGVDVVFIDGLHTHESAYRDCLNALRYLNPGGVIFMHDCLPASELEARAAASYEEAGRLNGPDWNGRWMGDAWKAIVALRSLHPDVEAYVLNCDYGVGVVRHQRVRRVLSYSADQIAALSFQDLVRDPVRLLGLQMPDRLLETLADLRARRAR
jgi:hypothetical protein